MSKIKRIYVEKKKQFNNEAEVLLADLKESTGIKHLKGLRILRRYDIAGISHEEYAQARTSVLSEPPLDTVYDETLKIGDDETVIAIEYLPGQYDQRADSAAQCIQIIARKEKPLISAAELFVLKGPLSPEEIDKIKKYLINPVDSREAGLEKPDKLRMDVTVPPDVEILENFLQLTEDQLEEFRASHELAMSPEDLRFCRAYFKQEEKRAPTITEIKMLDTYWSDHCRHTTFTTRISNVDIPATHFAEPIEAAYKKYLQAYKECRPDKEPDTSLMNIAVMSMREMRAKGKLDDMEVSGEINACSIIRDVEVDGKKEEWLVMFKNETHNHPTEIEPFGGAATCLGGAIRDPLSGRSFVYQAMRVTGSANPTGNIEDTLPGKLPQRKITTEAARGYSSYGNQIGVPTGLVSEVYDQGYLAKRMEVGAVIAAVPRKHVKRMEPVPGDVILLVGGRTGRDGIGGATGSSKEHTEESIHTAGAEVQKGNAPEERKIQRLFRNPKVTALIKKCNDFGAGGVSVAIGELADGLEINLDAVPKKYDGLDGTELALSESQERMAVVVAPTDVEKFKTLAAKENLETSQVALVTAAKRLKVSWRGKTIVDVSRDFIETNGIRQSIDIEVRAPEETHHYFNNRRPAVPGKPGKDTDLETAWMDNLKDLNHCCQKGLGELFDSSVGAFTVFCPYGGKYQDTPVESMAAKIPVLSGSTTTGTLMSYGFNPEISRWSPFHGAAYAVVEAVSRIVAAGGNYSTVRTSLQEYFEKLGRNPARWGKPFSALLGAYHAMVELEIAAIGGKDSMSGSFRELDVPPTLIAFAVDTADVRHMVTPEFKKPGTSIVFIKTNRDAHQLPSFRQLRSNFNAITTAIQKGKILSAQTVRNGGIALALSKMAFGNRIGFLFDQADEIDTLFAPQYGSFLLEMDAAEKETAKLFDGLDYRILGKTRAEASIGVNGIDLSLEAARSAWGETLEKVFPTDCPPPAGKLAQVTHDLYARRSPKKAAVKIARPRVLVPAFPGSNSEYETLAHLKQAGAVGDIMVFRNLTPACIEASLQELTERISKAQILAIPGGFSAGDEPDGSGKFIAAVFRNPMVKDAVTELLNKRDGLMVGICNGFQALIKLGLLPYGEIRDNETDSPTLTFNHIGRHISCMAQTKVVSVLSPWFSCSQPGDIHKIVLSHGEGRFVANQKAMAALVAAGQIATQYVDFEGNPAMNRPFNPNGSMNAVEALTSPDGRVLGKMGHSERMGPYIHKNVPGNKDQQIFESGVAYFA
ncbi:MAG: phosphoribosylformylglycinamidine synthase [bacterium]|nr:phosphoribosylformylglycinamidine synthase [bacterium]